MRSYLTKYIDKVSEKRAYSYKKWIQEIINLEELMIDDILKQEAENELKDLIDKIKQEIITDIFTEEERVSTYYMEIVCGTGGQDAEDWTNMLLNMYIRYFQNNNIKYNVVDIDSTEAGIKSATLEVKDILYKMMNESGTHRLVRISPFNALNKRQTSFAAVHIYPQIVLTKIKIEEKDLKIDTYRASGAGGQHVNKTESAIRITHLPSSIVVTCQDGRSQLDNKKTAMRMLESKLYIYEMQKIKKTSNIIKKSSASWGNQIRSYVLYPYQQIKDNRLDITITSHTKIESILKGDIDIFLQDCIDYRLNIICKEN